MNAKALAFAALLLAALPACAETTGSAPESAATTEISAEITNATEDAAPENRQVDLAELKEKYPEYFELSSFKGIEVYVWQMSKDSYSCGMMSGTNCLKTQEQIFALHEKALTVEEANAILDELGVNQTDIFVIPITQPHSSYYYEIDEAYREQVNKLFK